MKNFKQEENELNYKQFKEYFKKWLNYSLLFALTLGTTAFFLENRWKAAEACGIVGYIGRENLAGEIIA